MMDPSFKILEKPLKIFLGGDYHYLDNMIGHQGPSALHPSNLEQVVLASLHIMLGITLLLYNLLLKESKSLDDVTGGPDGKEKERIDFETTYGHVVIGVHCGAGVALTRACSCA